MIWMGNTGDCPDANDGDGDLDLVANCEEWWSLIGVEVPPYVQRQATPSTIAVVWFENTIGDPGPPSPPIAGRHGVEAESPTGRPTSTAACPRWSASRAAWMPDG